MGKKPTPEELLHAIRANCMDCCGGSRREVHNCKITQCKLWPYRREEPNPKETDNTDQLDRKWQKQDEQELKNNNENDLAALPDEREENI